jgi:hypothetical protein
VGTGSYANNNEELTSVRVDWDEYRAVGVDSIDPAHSSALVRALPRRFGAHVLSARTVQLIEREVVA